MNATHCATIVQTVTKNSKILHSNTIENVFDTEMWFFFSPFKRRFACQFSYLFDFLVPMCDAINSIFNWEKKDTNENATFFCKLNFFCYHLTVWTKVQEINVCDTRRSLFKVSTCDSYDIWHVLKHTVFHFRKSVFQSIKDFSTGEAFFLPFIFFIIIKFPSFNFRIRPVF